jgi:hypothetical protein
MSQLSIRKGFAPFFPLLLIAVASLNLSAQTLSLSSRSGPPTTRITVHGTGFPPATGITVAFGRSVVPVVSDGSGAFQTQIVVPASAQPGVHRVTAKIGTTVLVATSFLVRTNWPQFGFSPAGQRFNPYENTLNVFSVPGLQMLWSFYHFAPNGGVISSPAVANGMAYVAWGDRIVSAVNASTRAVLWSFPTGGYIDSSPAVADGMVYVGSGDFFARGDQGVRVLTSRRPRWPARMMSRIVPRRSANLVEIVPALILNDLRR